jgi:phosphoribosylformimino-5-aminoimidazole carboxamide ribotide isomerase
MRIIPAIDIIDGKCVRLTKGDYATQKVYNEDPLDMARQFEANGIAYLHLVDLDGAATGGIVNQKVLYDITTKTSLQVDFGGGIKSDRDIQIAFENGASQVTIGSIAVNKQALMLEWLETYGSKKIILGADCKARKITTMGWQQDSQWDVVDFIKMYETKGIEYVICTDVAKDGMLEGSSIDLYEEILSKTHIKLIASGGVTTLQEIQALRAMGCEGAIIGKALYEGKITLAEISKIC